MYSQSITLVYSHWPSIIIIVYLYFCIPIFECTIIIKSYKVKQLFDYIKIGIYSNSIPIINLKCVVAYFKNN